MNTSTPSLSGPGLDRRGFMQGAAAAGALTLVPWPLRTALAAPAPVLSGTEFQLEIGAVPLTINGRQATATGVNGQVPAPILRWHSPESPNDARRSTIWPLAGGRRFDAR